MPRRYVVIGTEAVAGQVARARPDATLVSTAAELRAIDPLDIAGIRLVDLADLDPPVVDAIELELYILRTVWPDIAIIDDADPPDLPEY